MSRHENIRGVEQRDLLIAAAIVSLAFLVASLARAETQVPSATAPAARSAAVHAPAPAVRPAQRPPGVTPGVPLTTGPTATAPASGPIIMPEGAGPQAPDPLAPGVQVVRFQGPPGLHVEVLSPSPSPVPIGDGAGLATVGLERGVGYRLRLSSITERRGAELFPVIEVVGHLHRPREIDPGRYPIRVIFTEEELWDVLDHNRLVTKVIYLEEPEGAIPLKLLKDQIPVVTVNPSEEPLRVAKALGRVMAIVRIGGRRPSIEELNGGATGDSGLDAIANAGRMRCPFVSTDGGPCPLPRGPVRGTPPAGRPWLPRDEYLCDGGDQGLPATIGGDGNLHGVDPRDAVMRFDVGLDDFRKPRVLPTNRVCVYAPRFAEIRVSTGTNEAIEVHGAAINQKLDTFALAQNRSYSRRLVQNQAAELARERRRAQGLKGELHTGEDSDMRGPDVYLNILHAKTDAQQQGAEIARNRVRPGLMKEKIRLDGIKTAESPVMTGLVEGPGQTVMSWRTNEMKGIETPPNRPGMAIIKRVSATEAEPGDTLTFVITYRNMGNTPIRSAAIIDSLLPRLEYVKGSAKGPRDTVFSSGENRVGSTELKWELPGVIAPGASGHVSFQAVVR
jgi:uncharacterized repeat protein (TIGR01451 family)